MEMVAALSTDCTCYPTHATMRIDENSKNEEHIPCEHSEQQTLCTDTYTVQSFVDVPTNSKGKATVTVKHTQRTMNIYILYTHTPRQSGHQPTHSTHRLQVFSLAKGVPRRVAA
jgi:hypothetical protein